jgi:hypothetical protein
VDERQGAVSLHFRDPLTRLAVAQRFPRPPRAFVATNVPPNPHHGMSNDTSAYTRAHILSTQARGCFTGKTSCHSQSLRVASALPPPAQSKGK